MGVKTLTMLDAQGGKDVVTRLGSGSFSLYICFVNTHTHTCGRWKLNDRVTRWDMINSVQVLPLRSPIILY